MDSFFSAVGFQRVDKLGLSLLALKMYSLYADIVSRNQPEKTDTDDIVESDTIENLYRLSEDIYEVVSM